MVWEKDKTMVDSKTLIRYSAPAFLLKFLLGFAVMDTDFAYANGDEAPAEPMPVVSEPMPPAPAPTASGFQHGPYVGVATGLRLDRHDVKTSVDDAGIVLPHGTIDNDFSVEDESFTGGLQLGYGLRFAEYFYGGIEGDILFGNMSESKNLGVNALNNTVDTQFSVKGRTRYGLALRLGGFWNKALFYGRFGVEWQRFKLNAASLGLTAAPLSAKYTKAAFTPGVGVEVGLNDKLSLGLEYRVALFSRKTETRSSEQAIVHDTVVRHKPRVDSVLIRLNYKIMTFQ